MDPNARAQLSQARDRAIAEVAQKRWDDAAAKVAALPGSWTLLQVGDGKRRCWVAATESRDGGRSFTAYLSYEQVRLDIVSRERALARDKQRREARKAQRELERLTDLAPFISGPTGSTTTEGQEDS